MARHKRESSKCKKRKRLEQRDGLGCLCCGFNYRLTIHHIKKLANGGSNNLDNLCQLCEACHVYLHQNEPKDFKKWVEQTQAFLSRIIYET